MSSRQRRSLGEKSRVMSWTERGSEKETRELVVEEEEGTRILDTQPIRKG